MSDDHESTIFVNRIQRFCLHDGPGLRTTVFLQGCSQRCWWCHNPDTIPPEHEHARRWPIEALLAVLGRDQRFWSRAGGGLTVSGGEPLLQSAALVPLLRAAGDRGWHRCIETAGQAPLAAVQAVAGVMDHWLFDIKSGDATRLAAATGGNLARIRSNLTWLLAETTATVCVRTPLINGFNNTAADWQALAALLADLPRRVPVRLLPGHSCGTDPERLTHDPLTPAAQVEAACHELVAAGLDAAITW